MTTTTEIRRTATRLAVAKGAALLDERVPGWASSIDLSVLDLGSCSECVLGQLFDDAAGPAQYGYHAGLAVLSGLPGTYELSGVHSRGEWAQEHGFTTIGGNDDWGRLRDLWVEQIEARRQS